MKIRGTLHVTKNLKLSNPGDSVPAQGKVLISDPDGEGTWGHIAVAPLTTSIYPVAGTLVRFQEEVYFSLADNASGQDIEDPLIWAKMGGATGTVLTQVQKEALDASVSPSAGNPYATMSAIQNLTIRGTDTVASILTKSALVKNILWLTSTDGVDSQGAAVIAGDAIVSNGTGWLGVGPFRGPEGPAGESVQGEQGLQGPPGEAPATFVYSQTVAAETWVIPHNLNKFPAVSVVNLGRSTIESTVNYVDENNVVVTVYPMSAGFAYLN